MIIAEKIAAWYFQNKRDLPWRKTKDPYLIWVSETILQQTQVSQGIDYYLRFIELFPTVRSLAEADEMEVLKTWQGLGYYSRARNLHHSARIIMNELNGNFPTNYKQLISLRGVGDYTASAVLSIAFGQGLPAIDGNVIRVITRLFGLDGNPAQADVRLLIRTKMTRLLEDQNPGVFNQAVMEFGALQCVPKEPDCATCILKDVCFADINDLVKELPSKISRPVKKSRCFNYFVLLLEKNGSSHVFLSKRPINGIWANLYEFPMTESGKICAYKEICNFVENNFLLKADHYQAETSGKVFSHFLTHQHIKAKFNVIRIKDKNPDFEFKMASLGAILIPVKEIDRFPVPRLVEKFLIENPL